MRTRTRRGFTMVELLASIGIIALSMAICLPVPDNALDGVIVEDDGPVTVRMFHCRVDDTPRQDLELEAREALLGTDMQFCGIETSDAGTFLSVWSPVNVGVDSNLEVLRANLGEAWSVEGPADSSALLAMN